MMIAGGGGRWKRPLLCPQQMGSSTQQRMCVCVCVSVCERERVGESNGNEAKKCHQGQKASNPKLTDILIGTSEF